MRYYRIKNWNKFQHYTKRNPPWIKLHYEILNSRDWIKAGYRTRCEMVVCILVASRCAGAVPEDAEYVQKVGHLRNKPDFKRLIEIGFLEELLADASTVQADAIIESESESESESEEEKNGYSFFGSVIRLTEDDFKRWEVAYPSIPNLNAELTALDDFYSREGIKDWFVRASSALKNRNHQYQKNASGIDWDIVHGRK